MARKFDDYAVEADVSTPTGIPTAGLTITKVVREHIPLHVRKGYGETIGQMIDQHIASCLANGDEIQEVTVGFDQMQWNALHA